MSEATSFILALIPLLLCPALVGILILPTDIQLSVCWWVGFTSISLSLLVFHGLGASREPTFVALIVCTAMLAIRERHKLLSRGKLPEPFHRGTFWVFLALLPLLIASCLITFSLPVSDFDAINIWFNKAKSLFYWQPFNQLPLCDYPNLGPMYWSFVMRFTSVEFESIGRLVFPLAYWFWALSLVTLLRNTSFRVCLFIAPLIGYTFFRGAPLTNGYQDGLLALCAGMSAIFSLRLLFELGDDHRADSSGQCLRRFRHLYMAACFFGGVLAWIKTEGMMVGLILVLVTTALCLASTARHLRRSLVRAIIPGLLTFSGIALSWPAVELVHGVRPWVIQGGAFEFGRLSSVFQRLGRLDSICEYLRRYLQEQKTVLGLLFVLGVAMLILCPRKTLRPALFLGAVLVLHAAFVVLVFLTTGQDLAWHLATAFDRLMFQNTLIVASGLTLLMRICAEEALALSGLRMRGNTEVPPIEDRQPGAFSPGECCSGRPIRHDEPLAGRLADSVAAIDPRRCWLVVLNLFGIAITSDGGTMNQKRQAGRADDAAELPSVPFQPSAPLAECAYGQSGKPLAEGGAPKEDRQQRLARGTTYGTTPLICPWNRRIDVL